MNLLSFLSPLSPLHMLWVRFTNRARLIGADGLGNRYFESPARTGYTHPRRFVVYAGRPEASAVPPEWHGWLHHQTNRVPDESTGFRRSWQLSPKSNATGTNAAYRPPGHVLEGSKRDAATGDYEAWTPGDRIS